MAVMREDVAAMERGDQGDYLARLYKFRREVLDARWTFPEAQHAAEVCN